MSDIEGGVRFTMTITFTAAQIADLHPDRIAALFDGMRTVIHAQRAEAAIAEVTEKLAALRKEHKALTVLEAEVEQLRLRAEERAPAPGEGTSRED